MVLALIINISIKRYKCKNSLFTLEIKAFETLLKESQKINIFPFNK